MSVRNPYAKKPPGKRPRFEWRSGPETSIQQELQEHQPNSSVQAGSVETDQVAPRSQQVTNKSSILPIDLCVDDQASKSTGRKSDEFNDPHIDWNEAVKLLDQPWSSDDSHKHINHSASNNTLHQDARPRDWNLEGMRNTSQQSVQQSYSSQQQRNRPALHLNHRPSSSLSTTSAVSSHAAGIIDSHLEARPTSSFGRIVPSSHKAVRDQSPCSLKSNPYAKKTTNPSCLVNTTSAHASEVEILEGRSVSAYARSSGPMSHESPLHRQNNPYAKTKTPLGVNQKSTNVSTTLKSRPTSSYPRPVPTVQIGCNQADFNSNVEVLPLSSSKGLSLSTHCEHLQSASPEKPNPYTKMVSIPDINDYKKSSKDAVVNTVNHDYTLPERPAISHPSGIPKPSEKNGLKPKSLESQSKHQVLASIRPKSWIESTSLSSSQGTPSIAKTASLRYTLDHHSSLPKELGFSPDSVKPIDDPYRRELVKHANISAPLLNGWDLYSHQKKAILKGLVMRRCILALDMGLGKTLIGCVWAKAFSKTFRNLKVIVICPVSLKSEWTKTAEQATGLTVEEEIPSKKKAKRKWSLDSDDEECDSCGHSEVVEICSWAKVPNSVDPSIEHYVVICDEAHSMQSMQAGRTKDVLQLALGKKCIGVLLLTGTPMKNGKPSNLFPLLKAVRHPFGKNQKAYEKHFCDGKEKSFGRGRVVWDANGSSNLSQLRELVSSHLLYLTKDECLKDLPPQTRTFRHVPISSRQQLEHSKALGDLAKVYESSSSVENSSEAVLGAVQRVRYVSSCAKVDATVQLAQNLLETTETALVIFTTFVKVAKSVQKKLEDAGWDGELLTGETPAKKRQSLVDRFQNGLSSVFVCTFGAGGVGLTLTAARTIILLDRPWTPGDAFQAEDRVRRIGQTKPVQSIWMSAFELDKQIDRVLEQKSKTANAVLSDSASSNPNGSGESPKISIFQLLRNVLPSSMNGRNHQQLSKDGLSQSSLDSFFGDTREGNCG